MLHSHPPIYPLADFVHESDDGGTVTRFNKATYPLLRSTDVIWGIDTVSRKHFLAHGKAAILHIKERSVESPIPSQICIEVAEKSEDLDVLIALVEDAKGPDETFN